MDPRTVGALGVAVPALVAGAVLLAIRRPGAGAIALGLAVLAGSLVVLGLPAFPPGEPHLWFGLLGAVSALGALERPRAVRVLARGLLALAAPVVVLAYVPGERLGRGALACWIALAGAGVLLVGTALDRLAARREGLALPLALWVVASGGAGAVALSGFVGGGQVAGAVAAGLGALAFFAAWRPVEGRTRAAVPVVASVLPAIWLDGYWMAELAPAAGLLLGAAPLGAWAGELPLLKARPKLAVAATVLGVLVPTAIALVLSRPE